MINTIVNKIKNSLEDNLPFVDKITGLVKPATISDAQGNVKTFPVAVNTNITTCSDSELLDFVPDSSKTSIIYFEDRGTIVRGLNAEAIEFTSNFTLVCWFNFKQIAHTLTNTGLIAANVIKYLPLGNIGTLDPLMNIFLEVTGQQTSDGAIFNRYSYREEISQYITYPYAYVALDLRADYRVRVACIEDIEPDVRPCEND